jgi:hypothetical protein
MSTWSEYIAPKVGATIIFLICTIIILLAIPGWYNLYLEGSTRRGEPFKYIFNDTGYDTSGTADVVSIVCAIIIFGVVIKAMTILI